MCKIWISWISTTDFSRVIVGYLGRIPGQLHNVLAVLRGEKPLGAAGGIAVGVVDRLLLGTRVPGAAALKLWPLLAAWAAGSLSGSWQSSLLAGMAALAAQITLLLLAMMEEMKGALIWLHWEERG